MKQLISIFIIIGIFSCSEKNEFIQKLPKKELTTIQVDSVLTNFKFIYENPIVLEKDSIVLMKMSTRVLRKKSGNFDSFSSGRYSKSSKYNRNNWNILFHNQKTETNHLLTKKKVKIFDVYVKSNQNIKYNKVLKNKILYKIGDIDFNQDNKLNHKDPQFLFASERNGKNLTRISPTDEDLQYFEVIPSSQQILMKTLRDSNQDSLFTFKDEYIWYKAELQNSEWKLQEMIDSTQRNNIEHLYFEQWLTK